jgi:hypothetical protein
MVLAATAVPVEFHSPGTLGFSIQPGDVVANVAGYVPVGIALAGIAPMRAMLMAAAMTGFAESSQFFMMHRDPSAVDVVANLIGASLGIAIAARWNIRAPGFRLTRWRAMAAVVLAAMLAVGVSVSAGAPLSRQGATAEGELEAHWTFDEPDGHVALDSSGHDVRGTFHHQPTRVVGVRGNAVAFDGARDYIDFGHPPGFRLIGSLTISAWIKSASQPVDDAAIVSTLRHVGSHSDEGYGVGFQLDTTIDRGPRTVGFKLADVCGKLLQRYGATPLQIGRWYHVAGVYDAQARAMNVYVNGELDNGYLHGPVAGARRSSRESLYVGRRSDLKGFEFAGEIDDVRVYSRALTQPEVAADMRGTAGESRAAGPSSTPNGSGAAMSEGKSYADCSWSSEHEDARIPAAVAALGVLVAVACLGLCPSGGATVCLMASSFAGFLLFFVASPTLPPINLWLFPFTSLAGGLSVAASLRSARHSDSSA